MGFLHGRVGFERFRVGGRELKHFDQKEVDLLDANAIGKVGAVTADGVEVGFTAGDHIFDLGFGLEKNVINDALHFGFRVDTNKIPADLMKAYTQMEVALLSADNPSGFPTKVQRQQAKEIAQQRLEEEAKTGRFRRMKQYPVLWDVRQGVLYVGTSSLSVIDRLLVLFKEAFGRTLSRVTAGSLAHEIAAEQGHARAMEDLNPSVFAGQARKLNVAWVQSDMGSRDFVGNEFLMWLWWSLVEQTDTVALSDDSTAICMLSRTLTLECPLSETGKETIAHEAPSQLPEAIRAVQSGKWPRKSGLLVVRHEEQYDLAIQAETLAVSGCAMPKLDSDSARAELEDRVDQIRHLTETLDLLYAAFLQRRLTSAWSEDLRKLRAWLKQED